MHRNIEINSRAFSTIELLIALAVFGLVAVGFYGSIFYSNKVSAINKSKIIATSILDNEVEQIKAKKYSDIGISGAEPSGNINLSTTKTVSAIKYNISRSVFWVDDAKDGLGASDSDGNTHDYKAVKITASWNIFNLSFSQKRIINIYGTN